MKKYIISAFCLLLLYACTQGGSENNNKPKTGEELFRQYCVICHGVDGKLGTGGAKDLSTSSMNLDERINRITYGKDLMTPFTGVLTEKEIETVAQYTLSLKSAN